MEDLELLVVIDHVTATAELADYVYPSASVRAWMFQT